MAFKNPRNSRDDNSKNFSSGGSRSGKSSSPRFSGPKSESSNKPGKKLFGDSASDNEKKAFRTNDMGKNDKDSSRRKQTEDKFERRPKSSESGDSRPGNRNFNSKSSSYKSGDKPFGNRRPDNRFEKGEKSGEGRSFDRPVTERREGSNERRERSNDRPFTERREGGNDLRQEGTDRRPGKQFGNKSFKSGQKRFEDRGAKGERSSAERNPYGQNRNWTSEERLENNNLRARKNAAPTDGKIRLNRYIANAGICSRRKADELIA